jgi:hypothetical protein
MSTSDTETELDIPTEYTEAIKLFAVMRALQSADELDRADVIETEYFNKKSNIVRLSGKLKAPRVGSWKVVR